MAAGRVRGIALGNLNFGLGRLRLTDVVVDFDVGGDKGISKMSPEGAIGVCLVAETSFRLADLLEDVWLIFRRLLDLSSASKSGRSSSPNDESGEVEKGPD
jgi:hypothetical protein